MIGLAYHILRRKQVVLLSHLEIHHATDHLSAMEEEIIGNEDGGGVASPQSLHKDGARPIQWLLSP
jgi:hypothetical protein